jgi:hypothetical protein
MNADRGRLHAGVLLAPAVLLLLAACGGGSGQSGSAFVFLSVAQITGNAGGSANSILDDAASSTVVCVAITNTLKSPTVTVPTLLDNVTITSYTVTYTRFDGGPPPGPFTFNTAFTVPAGTPGSTTQVIVIVPAQAKRAPPLLPFPRLPLTATADMVFKGRDGRGNGVSTEGAVTVNFILGGTDGTAGTCSAPSGPSPTPTPTPTAVL